MIPHVYLQMQFMPHEKPICKLRIMNCSNQELHVIHIILQINDPSSASPRQCQDRGWMRRSRCSPQCSAGWSVVPGSALRCARHCQGSLFHCKPAAGRLKSSTDFKRSSFCMCSQRKMLWERRVNRCGSAAR